MVYVFLANGFEEVEALTPIDCLRRCGIKVVTVGVGGEYITSSHNITVKADITEDKVELSKDIQMIICPGGMPGTLNLEKSETVQNTIDFCVQNDIYVACICAGPIILGHKGLLNGKTACCYQGFEKDLIGANVIYDAVAVDGKFITSRGMGVALDFGVKLVEVLKSKEVASDLLNKIMYPTV
ncbi:MAG: DJ-1/PfpI family protein [Ruminococcus sp.]|nr:DJ-1/PfpI family protein [Ruminococcus sp.]